MRTISKFFVELDHNSFFLFWSELVYFRLVVDQIGTSPQNQLIVSFVILPHLLDQSELFFDRLSAFSESRQTVTDFIDQICEDNDA